MLGKAKSVNPFLTIMFLKMSFKSWLNMTKKVKERLMKKNHFRRRLSRKNSLLPMHQV